MKRWNIFLGIAVMLGIVGMVRLIFSVSIQIPEGLVFWIYVIIVVVVFFVSVPLVFFGVGMIEDKRREAKKRKQEVEWKIIKEIKNGAGDLHSLTESAIIRKNGNEEYYIDGVEVEVNLWKQIVNKSLSMQDCFQIRNIEQRRIAMKYCLTPDKFLENWKELKLTNRDKRGNTLYEYTHEELNEPVKVLVYKDPSTDRTYYSFVPPSMASATRAMAWKFQLTDQEYDNLRFEA